ncbi:hypothetical protein [Chthonobacter rhizosphaerae]|uniref:hypothetical protein n=1 Tax=Chthonobacter rhizosphaerae TaxID=2735553 RepID=UPI0015EF2537|nr:hypothetical protein [Chthonobacter rhizosphaerae]
MGQRFDRVSMWLLGLMAGGMVVGAVALVPVELRPYLDQLADHKALFERYRARAGDDRPFVSLNAWKMELDRCANLSPALIGGSEGGGPEMAEILDVCGAMAEAAVAGSPNFAYGWYIAGGAAMRTGKPAEAYRRYLRSAATNPAEIWIASLRFQVFDRPGVQLPADVAAAADRDVALLLANGASLERVARRYVDDPAFRKRLPAIAGALSADRQADFVGRVRQLMARDRARPQAAPAMPSPG